MKKKIALLSICVVGLLVVLTLLAFSANAPHSAVTSSTTLNQPTQVDSSAPTSELTLKTNASDEADSASVKSSSSGHHCDGETMNSAGY